MNTITFDTHSFVKQLQAKGISEEQSEAFVATMVNIQNAANNSFATKSETTQFKSELSSDIKLLESRIDIKLEQIRAETSLIKWAMGLSITLSISILLKIFFS